jgi:hypothetical protein
MLAIHSSANSNKNLKTKLKTPRDKNTHAILLYIDPSNEYIHTYVQNKYIHTILRRLGDMEGSE